MSQSDNSIKNQIIDFYNDPLYQKLNAYYGKTTIFNILKIERNENRHSAFLAWLLDKNGSHGLGEVPLKKFMRMLAWADKDSKYDNPFLMGNYRIENMEVKTERPAETKGREKSGRVDIDIEFGYIFNIGENPSLVHVILENKIYTKEHDKQTKLYREWAIEDKEKRQKDIQIIGVFLSPEFTEKCDGDTDNFKYVKITYDDLLKFVIEPLLALDMSITTCNLLTDYVINLGQPVKVKKEDPNDCETKDDTILALSNDNKDCFSKLYQNFTELIDTSLYSYAYKKEKTQLFKELYGNDDGYCNIENCFSNNKDLLYSFWTSNERLLRMILDTGLNDIYGDKKDLIAKLLEIKANNHQIFIFNGQNFEVKGRLCHAIIKSYAEQHQNATINDLQAVFDTQIKGDNKIVLTPDDAMKTKDSNGTKAGNYYMKKEDVILLKDGEVVVWNYWPDRFFIPFMNKVQSLKFEIEVIDK